MSPRENRVDPIERRPITEGLGDLLRQSIHLMARNGFHGASMRDLAKATGRSLSGLYHYARSKEDLLFLVNYHGFTTLLENWGKISLALGNPHERLYGFIFFHVRYFAEHEDEMRIMMWGTQALHPVRARAIRELKDRYARAARDIVRETHEAETGRTLSKKALSRKTFLLFGMMNWIYSWYSAPEHGALDDLVRDIYGTFLHGLSRIPRRPADVEKVRRAVGRSFRDHRVASPWD